MRIEEVIQQKFFKNERQKAIVNLVYTYNWVTGHIKEFLRPYGVTMQQFNVLRILRGHYPENMSTSAIRDRMLDRNSDASRIVERLYKAGLVEKKICSQDRRLVDVKITEQGLEILEKIDKDIDQMEAVFDSIPEQELKQLNQLLDRLKD